MPALIDVEELRKSYGGVERVHGISFEVQAGEIIGFLGTNGAGKTTTIEILEGYRHRDSGRVHVLGTDPARGDRAWRNRIGLVLQECELDPAYTVRETVSMFARYFDEPTDVTTVMSAVGLVEQEDQRIGRLSGGQKRRVDVALGLVGDPEILFLDEPTTGLDPSARREMWAMIEALHHTGKTVFLTTHYMDEAQHLADRIIILRAGEIAAEGTVEDLRRSLGGWTEVSFMLPETVAPERLRAGTGIDVEVDGTGARFRTVRVQEDLTALLTWAADEHVDLGALQAIEPTLDDVFVELAEGHDTGNGAPAR